MQTSCETTFMSCIYFFANYHFLVWMQTLEVWAFMNNSFSYMLFCEASAASSSFSFRLSRCISVRGSLPLVELHPSLSVVPIHTDWHINTGSILCTYHPPLSRALVVSVMCTTVTLSPSSDVLLGALMVVVHREWESTDPIPFTGLFIPSSQRWCARSVPGAHMLRGSQADRNDCGLLWYHSVPVETSPHYVWEQVRYNISELGKPFHSTTHTP